MQERRAHRGAHRDYAWRSIYATVVFLTLASAPSSLCAQAAAVGDERTLAAADLDGDGGNEVLTVRVVAVQPHEELEYRLDGVPLDIGERFEPDEVWVVDIDPRDERREIALRMVEGCGEEAETRVVTWARRARVLGGGRRCLSNVRIPGDGTLSSSVYACYEEPSGRIVASITTWVYRLRRGRFRTAGRRRRSLRGETGCAG